MLSPSAGADPSGSVLFCPQNRLQCSGWEFIIRKHGAPLRAKYAPYLRRKTEKDHPSLRCFGSLPGLYGQVSSISCASISFSATCSSSESPSSLFKCSNLVEVGTILSVPALQYLALNVKVNTVLSFLKHSILQSKCKRGEIISRPASVLLYQSAASCSSAAIRWHSGSTCRASPV